MTSCLDHTTIVYLLGVMVSIYGFLLFVANWIRIGRASSVYKCVTLLLLGQILAYTACLISRIAVFNGDTGPLFSWWWPLRNYLTILALFLLVLAMTKRWLEDGRRKEKETKL